MGSEAGARTGWKSLLFRYPYVGRGGSKKGVSESVPFIHEKWRKSELCVTAPGPGDLERAKAEDNRIKLRIRRLRLALRSLQMICSYCPLLPPVSVVWEVNFKVIDCCAYWTEFGDVSCDGG